MFALDVFNEGHGFWTTLSHLFMHLVPSFVLIGMLVLAWRWEWVGAVLFAAAGAFFFYIGRPTLATKVLVSSPAFFTALLFLLSWRLRATSPSPDR